VAERGTIGRAVVLITHYCQPRSNQGFGLRWCLVGGKQQMQIMRLGALRATLWRATLRTSFWVRAGRATLARLWVTSWISFRAVAESFAISVY